MIIHRPHRGGLNEAMKEARQFTSLGECINTLIQEHNNSHSFQVSESDIYLIPYGLNGDDRIGWKDTFMICCAPYDLVKDQHGYELYYGGKYNHPIQLFGFVSTDYKLNEQFLLGGKQMSISKDHMSYERCIDILESELGDHEPKEAYAGVHIAQAFRISIELLKRELPMQPKKDMRNTRYGMGYEYNDWICPRCELFLAYEQNKSEIPIRCPHCGQKLMT